MERYNFLRLLTQSITDYQVRNAIASDVFAQVDEVIPAFEKKGMTRKQAEKKAIRNMGKPEDVIQSYLQKYKPANEVKNILIYLIFAGFGFVAMWGFTQNGLFKDEVVDTMFTAAGYLLMIYGLFSGMQGNMAFPFKNKFGGYAYNVYVICAAGTALVARNYIQWLVWTIVLGSIVCIERIISGKKQMKKVEKFIWKTGEVVSDIDRKGSVRVDSEIVKARSIDAPIPSGTKIVVVNVDGAYLVVKQA